jgi:hypothetical protein
MDFKVARIKRKIQIAEHEEWRKESKCGTTSESRSSNSGQEIRGRNRAMPQSRGKLAHYVDRPAKPHGRSAMSCGLPVLVKFISGAHNSTKYVVILGLAVMVCKLW